MNTKEEIIKLRNQSKSYKEIADILNVPVGTVNSVCQRMNSDLVTDKCLFCGSPLVHNKNSVRLQLILTLLTLKSCQQLLQIGIQEYGIS